jgi:hypothetical protein
VSGQSSAGLCGEEYSKIPRASGICLRLLRSRCGGTGDLDALSGDDAGGVHISAFIIIVESCVAVGEYRNFVARLDEGEHPKFELGGGFGRAVTPVLVLSLHGGPPMRGGFHVQRRLRY